MLGAAAPPRARTAGDLAGLGVFQKSGADRLADDVLLEVFDFYRLDAPGSTETGWLWAWHPLAQVCRRWRRVVLSSPKRLRLDPYLTNGSPASSILLRSPTLLITLSYLKEQHDDDYELIPWPPGDIEDLTLAFKQTDRIREISIFQDCEVLREFFATMTEPAPHLGTLYIKSDQTFSILPVGFLSGSVPALRALHLYKVLPPLPSTPCLTHFSFSLGDDNSDAQDDYMINELFTKVWAMPLLETLQLDLSLVGPIYGPLTPSNCPTVFSVLSSITFIGLSRHFETLISGMATPELVTLRLSFTDKFVVSIPSFSRFIQCSPKLSVPATAELILSPARESSLKTRSSLLPKYAEHTISLKMHKLELNALMASIAPICRSLGPALSSAEKLIVAHSYLPSDRDHEQGMQWADHLPEWHTVFAAFTGARNVIVRNVFTLALAQTLGRPRGVKLLPNLRDLQLLFYSADGYNPSDILVKLEPFITAHHAGSRLDVCCKTIPSRRQHPELRGCCPMLEHFLNYRRQRRDS
ncbi:hypothetical protein BC834DRAFT_1045583 [Gloeopeniophorella convolvens]|nr:hypothetical protein BC834DRAFT_1045583 [Gloeopeniophorella convolvens]